MENDCELLPIMLNRKTDRKRNSFLYSFQKHCFKKDVNNLSIKRQTAYLMLTRSLLKALLLFSCTAVVQASDSMTASTKSFKWLVEDGQAVCYINYWFSLALTCSVDIYSIVSSKCFIDLNVFR